MTSGKSEGGRRRMLWDKPWFAAENAWMMEHATAEKFAPDIAIEFEEHFGYPISPNSIKLWKANHGIKSPHYSHSKMGRQWDRPIGTERVCKPKGGGTYIMVKVREFPTKPGSKDNWEMKHKMIYEAAHGKLSDDMTVWFADGDHSNFALDNLVAIPRKYNSSLNNPGMNLHWHDRETLLAAVEACKLSSAISEARLSLPRKCGVCGREFVPDPNNKTYQKSKRQLSKSRTCQACLDAGHKYQPSKPNMDVTKTCKVCGNEFHPCKGHQTRCQECIDANPHVSAKNQARFYARHGRRA